MDEQERLAHADGPETFLRGVLRRAEDGGVSNKKWTFKLTDMQVAATIACIECAREDVAAEHLNTKVARKIALRQIDELLTIFRDVGVDA